MKKIIALFCTIVLSTGFLLTTNVFADTDAYLTNFKIKAQQQLSEYWIDNTSNGKYLGVSLNLNGDIKDTVYFWGADSNENTISNYGTAQEGQGLKWVKYTDGQNSRFLHKVYFKSHHYNWSHYYINGFIRY